MSESYDHSGKEAYPFLDLWINGRSVLIESILRESVDARSRFERSTFDFVRDWMTGVETFTMSTSGSTGIPKNITHTRRGMLASARRTVEKIGIKKFSTALICLDTQYIAGKMMLVRCLSSGLSIMALDPVAQPLIKIPADKCVQFTAFVPYQVDAILESKHPHLLNKFDHVLIGGAALSATTVEKLGPFRCACYETYGMTETISHIALRLVNTGLKQQYFETLPGIEIQTDARGCLVIDADYLEKSVITNDIVEIVGPRKFLWLGRWDTVINSGGVKVMPEKIEKLLERIFQGVNFDNRFFIAAWPDERLGSKVVLVIEGVQFSSETLKRSLEALKTAVSPFEVPKEVYSVPNFLFTETLKIDRKQTLSGAAFVSTVK
jgi:O-succinylbenzoic acid--CoA ligase